MSVPTEAGELAEFTPPSLANVAAPPVFKLRPATVREFRRFQYLLRAEGLQFHALVAVQAAVLDALRVLYSPDDFDAQAARLKQHWALIEQKGEPPADEVAAVNELLERLTREWPPLARMLADNVRFGEESIRVAVSMFLAGWSGFDLPYRRVDGRVPLDLVDALERKLEEIERQALEDKVEGVAMPGVAFIQVANQAYARLHLTETERKNSVSPPPSPKGRSGSRTKRSRRTAAARSPASASSAKG